MRILFYIFFIAAVAGCVTVPDAKPKGIATGHQVHLGMSRREVMAIMGDQAIIGYEQSDSSSGAFAPIVVKQPHRKETLRTGKRIYRVLYYFTQIRNADNVITDDELTPYIFEFDSYIGKGWNLLKDISRPDEDQP